MHTAAQISLPPPHERRARLTLIYPDLTFDTADFFSCIAPEASFLAPLYNPLELETLRTLARALGSKMAFRPNVPESDSHFLFVVDELRELNSKAQVAFLQKHAPQP